MALFYSYVAAFGFSLAIILLSAAYAYKHYAKTSEMCCMMVGMAYGTVAGFAAGTLLVLPTGDYVLGMMGGTALGLLVGVPMGRWGGALGRMEGVMAGVMGGQMGAMVGLMVRPFDVTLFMAYYFAMLALLMGEMAYVMYKSAKVSFPKRGAALFALISLVALALPFFLDFSVF
ncbi:hypothetical protein HY572_06210 [Candidatus Micrarchaeota archaeon]|nr:hypothetical protein [Candidatus Micrarchaeota archaeon]